MTVSSDEWDLAIAIFSIRGSFRCKIQEKSGCAKYFYSRDNSQKSWTNVDTSTGSHANQPGRIPG
ncbi:MAG: hypothetical protein JW839_11220, partial [Candidatus Lokiarchaeota archaeon]|nr:hypothetical protein [Candidatus Lokiarchaeota archaeon]